MFANEDDFLTPENPVIVGRCSECGGEIYKGELIYRIDGDEIHEDCLWDWMKARYVTEVADGN